MIIIFISPTNEFRDAVGECNKLTIFHCRTYASHTIIILYVMIKLQVPNVVADDRPIGLIKISVSASIHNVSQTNKYNIFHEVSQNA